MTDVTVAARTAVSYKPVAYAATPAASAYELLLLKRLGCGFSQAGLAEVRKAGGIDAWLDRQLQPDLTADTAQARAVDGWFPWLTRSAAEKVATNTSGSMKAWQYSIDLANWSTLKRMYSAWPVLETMVDFWGNHLHVAAGDERAYAHLHDYHQMLRRMALGRFEDLLVAASTHPAMSLYLDNWRSTRNAPNENQGRELLELHTVGRGAGYTEDMVKDSAKILSGWSVRWGSSYDGFYDAANHTTGPVRVLDFSHANSSSDGRAVCDAYLRYLANHPATARVVARRLAVRFVSDTPSEGLVTHLADTFTSSGTDIAATLRALVAHPEFRGSAGAKVSTPVDDLVATVRALGVTATAPAAGRPAKAFAHALNYFHNGLRLHTWPRPDGAPETNGEWSSGVRMLHSFRVHWLLAGGYYPKLAVRYRSGASFIPATRMSFAAYVDHLSRTLLGTPSTEKVLRAACAATKLSPTTTITRKHGVARYQFPMVASVLLDSPAHLTR